MTELERLHKLMGVLTVAYVWCYATGEWVNQQKKIPVKKHHRLAKSLFRAGLDRLRCAILHFATNKKRLIELVNMLLKRGMPSPQFVEPANTMISQVD